MGRKPNSSKAIIDEILGVDPRGDHPSVKRSSHWPKVMHAHLLKEPVCQVCGHNKGLNVHHVRPYALFPHLELDPSNLITLCTRGHDCHLLWGHLGSFQKRFNPTIREDAAIMRFKILIAARISAMVRNGKLQ